MTLRERIADAICGGKLSKTKKQLTNALNLLDIEIKGAHMDRQDLEICRSAQNKTREAALNALSGMERYEDALRAIIERGNTAKPNGTVKAMVRIAREGLGR